ncbi:MAG: hypothetical protein IJP90_05730 [Treponema sp.]|nr:hypothetical protein [Treponema sp.]
MRRLYHKFCANQLATASTFVVVLVQLFAIPLSLQPRIHSLGSFSLWPALPWLLSSA